MTPNIKEIVNQAAPGAHISQEPAEPHVCVALALFNGSDMIEDQLASLTAQSHRNISLIVSDDGSQDDGPDLVARFARSCSQISTHIILGPRKGFAQNFLGLVQAAGKRVPYLAFCDQDDVWRSEKLTRAVTTLKQQPRDVPALYCSRTIICDKVLNPKGISPLFKRRPSFANALVQNIGGGNTMVLNRAAIDLVQETFVHSKDIIAHDWWVYQLVTGAGGTVFFDQHPTVKYRQHGKNQIGANSSLAASAKRLVQLLKGRFRTWNAINIAALRKASPRFTKDAQIQLMHFEEARSGPVWKRWANYRASGVYRQTVRGNIALALAVLIKRL